MSISLLESQAFQGTSGPIPLLLSNFQWWLGLDGVGYTFTKAAGDTMLQGFPESFPQQARSGLEERRKNQQDEML